MKIKFKSLSDAMHKLGVKSGKVHIEVAFYRARVYLNGEYFGIFDFARKTFVD